MILEPAIINLTSNLDVICQQDGKGVSSHEKLKEKALNCLTTLLANAPRSEYASLLKANDSEILMGYLLSILCRLAKDDKSRSIRLLSLKTMEVLVDKLGMHHDHSSPGNCSVASIVSALPGVSSSLFKIIISDTKLPKNLLIKTIQVLGKVISAALSPSHYDASDLVNVCDNLAVRIQFMLNYTMANSSLLSEDVKYETLNFCLIIIKISPLVSKSLKPVLRYMAFISSTNSEMKIELELLLMRGEIRSKIEGQEDVETVIIKCLFDLLSNLESNCLSMLSDERQSELEMLHGILGLLPTETMSSLIETSSRKDQILSIMINLTEFSISQPLLFLTECHVDTNALQQMNDNRIYTIEKRFAHLNEKEIVLISDCCRMIGSITYLPLVIDTIRSDLTQFSSPNNLYVANQVIQGMITREDLATIIVPRFASETIQRYQEVIEERISELTNEKERSYTKDILILVILIETIVKLVELYLRSLQDLSASVVILKELICPLLNWCSSSNRAISEASLSAINQIALLYGHDSTKSLIEKNTDYIIDKATKMLSNFPYNPEVTNVIAITFKLSSMDTFYFFRDVYEKVFQVLTKYHQTKKSVPLALLLYRTVKILNEQYPNCDESSHTDAMREQAKRLNIDEAIRKLRKKLDDVREINKVMESDHLEPLNEDQTETDEPPPWPEPKVKRGNEFVLTEKILKHCIGLMSSAQRETKILALKTTALGLNILKDDENTLLPLVHQLWTPLLSRLNRNYADHLEENLCALQCLVAMATHAKDFIKRRALDTVIPRLCIFLESQWSYSRGKREFDPYCMTMVYKCQLRILSSLGQLAFYTQIAYTSLWRIINVALKYLDPLQVSALRNAALTTLDYLIALDADCVWFFAKRSGKLEEIHSLNLVLDLSNDADCPT